MQGTRRPAFFVPLCARHPSFLAHSASHACHSGHAISAAGGERVAFEWKEAAEGGRVSSLDRTDVHGASGTRRSLHGAAGASNLVFCSIYGHLTRA